MSNEYSEAVELARFHDPDGRIYRVTWQTHKPSGQVRVSLREWFEREGKILPTKRGLQTTGFESLLGLWRAIRLAVEEAIAEGLVDPTAYAAKRGHALDAKLIRAFAKMRARRAKEKAKEK